MFYYRPISDLHIEFDRFFYNRYFKKRPDLHDVYEPTVLDTDKNTVLGIAGDIDSKKHTIAFLKKMSTRFKAVVAVLGNHDYWRRDFTSHANNIKAELKREGYDNVHLLDRDSVVIEGHRFIGATLWTDFNKGDTLLMNQSASLMNDYKFLRKDNYERRVIPADILGEHRKAVKFIFDFADKDESMIVLSHHAPSFKSVDYSRYGFGPINSLYATEFGNDIAYSNFLLWHHGHTHSSKKYKIYNTDIICNPRGYCGSQMNPDFDDTFLVELK